MALEMRDYHKNIFCVGGNQFVNWDTVCKIEVLMQQYVYCYDNPVFVGNSKHVRSESEARFISQVREFDIDTDMSVIDGHTAIKEKEVEMDLRFLDCPEFMGMKV